MRHHGIQFLNSAAESHWQLGRVEIANRVLRNMAQRIWRDTPRPLEEVVEMCATTRNEHLRRCGFSPSQLFLGRDPRHAAALHDVDEQNNPASQSQVLAEPDFHHMVNRPQKLS